MQGSSFAFHHYLRRRLDELENQKYTKALHDQVLADFKREYLEPELFKKPKAPLRKKRKYTKRRSPEYYDRDELAQKLGRSIMTIKRMEKDGRLPQPVRLGQKTVLFPRAFIDKWLMASRGELRSTATS